MLQMLLYLRSWARAESQWYEHNPNWEYHYG